MSKTNADTHQLSKIVKKLGSVMDKINFTSEIPADDAVKIRDEINEVKAYLFMMSDINPDIKGIELFQKAADFVETTLNILTRPHQNLI